MLAMPSTSALKLTFADVHNVQNASTGGDDTLDATPTLTGLATLDLVLAAVILAGRTHIASWESFHHVADDGGAGDALPLKKPISTSASG